ncbi:hypothetical protein F993_02577 [Acinetobacter proteolyticus]|jgi:hypothetical protein|uniref:Uncharacterized protein n=1 Tax=Acinetobacter proteolyticus TaxID=1776741 RepID=A0A653K4K5_9GAMM|nr:hypothetical protein [Acinetobacter proteolyticus]ENU22676.1 hypothetical protein F993_02577 [Acinetobacter proteolyticus]VXA55774.1 conserved exported hypothetical protein [Acinetobacter proteolyticus]
MKGFRPLFALYLSLIATSGFAELNDLSDLELQSTVGQAGADLSLALSLNQGPVMGTVNNSILAMYDPARTPQFDTSLCLKDALEYCRLAIALNNRSVDTSGNPLGTNVGKKQWITFKGIQGTVNIPKLGIDGVDVTYTKVGGGTVNKPALQFSFDPKVPIQVRNLGFQSLAIETDTDLNSDATPTPAASNTLTRGYLKKVQYGDASGAFDANNPNYSEKVGREQGFLGVNMNANLSLTGSIKMFSCAGGTHARC